MNFHSLLAFEPEAMMAIGVPIIIFMIPIVAILTKHQQKMAMIMREGNLEAHVDANQTRHDVEQLKTLVQQQALQIEELVTLQKKTLSQSTDSLEERLSR